MGSAHDQHNPDDPRNPLRRSRSGNTRHPVLALIGLRGSGKTTVGRVLAQKIGCALLDTDAEIMRRAGRSICEIFAESGEQEFRRLERALIGALSGRLGGKLGGEVNGELSGELGGDIRMVLSVGGGAVLDEDNVAVLRSIATVVWLTAPPQMLWERVSADATSNATRPPLTDQEGLAELEGLLLARRERYEASADFTIDTCGKTPDAVAAEILHTLDAAAIDG